jgi:hypothetical protein
LLYLAVVEGGRGRAFVLYIDLGKLGAGCPAFRQNLGDYIGIYKWGFFANSHVPSLPNMKFVRSVEPHETPTI